MKKHTKEDIKRIEDRLRKIKKTEIKEDTDEKIKRAGEELRKLRIRVEKERRTKESTAEVTSPGIQEGEESAWQFSDLGSISVFETKEETEK